MYVDKEPFCYSVTQGVMCYAGCYAGCCAGCYPGCYAGYPIVLCAPFCGSYTC